MTVTLTSKRPTLKPYIIHVDAKVLKTNREKGKRDPIVRIIDPRTGKKYYGDWVIVHGPSWLDTLWDKPLPDRPNAVCVLRTHHMVEFGHGEMPNYG